MNLHAVRRDSTASRWRATQPHPGCKASSRRVISTSLYFVVFGAAIGSRMSTIEGVAYGAFIGPGLMMLMLLTQSVSNAAIGSTSPVSRGTIYEVLVRRQHPLSRSCSAMWARRRASRSGLA